MLIRDSLFDEMPLELKHDLVTKLLPEDIRHDFIQQSTLTIEFEDQLISLISETKLSLNRRGIFHGRSLLIAR